MDFKNKFGLKIPAALICGCIIFGGGCYDSKRHLRIKELERECVYITPDSGKKVGYKLEDGRVATVEHLEGGFFGRDRLEIELDNVSFRSKGISPEDARVLQTLFIKNGGKWESFTKENVQNYNSWWIEYEGLIDKIAERRAKFEKNALDRIEYDRIK